MQAKGQLKKRPNRQRQAQQSELEAKWMKHGVDEETLAQKPSLSKRSTLMNLRAHRIFG